MKAFAAFKAQHGSMIKVDAIKVNGIIHGLEHADNSELLAACREGLTDWLVGAKKIYGKLGANDRGVLVSDAVDELAVTKWQLRDVCQVGRGSDDGAVSDGVGACLLYTSDAADE